MLICKWMDVSKIKSITELKTESDYSATWMEYATPKLLLNSTAVAQEWPKGTLTYGKCDCGHLVVLNIKLCLLTFFFSESCNCHRKS